MSKSSQLSYRLTLEQLVSGVTRGRPVAVCTHQNGRVTENVVNETNAQVEKLTHV